MFRVGAADGQKVIYVDDDASLLDDSEGALGARLLHVPHHGIVNSLSAKRAMLAKITVRYLHS